MKRSSMKGTYTEKPAQLWAEKIVQVRSGNITASEAARQMDVSRKTYYQKERKALSGMMAGLKSRDAGRPKVQVDPEKERMRVQLLRLHEELTILKYAQRVHAVLGGAGKKKKSA